jgi:hypothetical protein
MPFPNGKQFTVSANCDENFLGSMIDWIGILLRASAYIIDSAFITIRDRAVLDSPELFAQKRAELWFLPLPRRTVTWAAARAVTGADLFSSPPSQHQASWFHGKQYLQMQMRSTKPEQQAISIHSAASVSRKHWARTEGWRVIQERSSSEEKYETATFCCIIPGY